MRRGVAWAGLAGVLVVWAWAVPASASCTNDTDCDGATCGGEVCQWSSTGHSCVPAGTDPQGSDGWCTTDSNCKCMGEGATCQSNSHCTFTLADPEASAATGSSGGYTASGGGGYASSASSSGAAPSGSSGSGEMLPDGGVVSGTTTPGDSGGCAAGGAGAAPGSLCVLACAAAVGLARRRRR